MVYVFISYFYSPDVSTPEAWMQRVAASAGILEDLATDNTVISIKQIDYTGIYLQKGVQYHFISTNRKRTKFPFKYNAYIKNLQPDIVIINGLHHPLEALQLRILLGSKPLIFFHHHAELPFNRFGKYAQRLASHYADAYLFASKSLGQSWVDRGNIAYPDKIHEVMEVSSTFSPIDKNIARAKTGVQGEQIYLWVGRLNANKDPLLAVNAFLKYTKSNAGVRLYMIYHTVELLNDIQDIFKDHELGSNVILIGKVPHPELLYWFNSADFILSASHYEGSGLAICEAMSCGCIPVVTNIDSFRMMTNNGECGILYEAGNGDALLSALLQTQSINIRDMKTKILDYYTATLSFSSIADKFREIVAGVVR